MRLTPGGVEEGAWWMLMPLRANAPDFFFYLCVCSAALRRLCI
jgi:hypothetical protein